MFGHSLYIIPINMNSTLTLKFKATDKKAAIVCGLFVLVFVVLTVTQDLVRSNLKNSAFYFFESFMFSSFWWPFAPLFLVQYFFIELKYKSGHLSQSAVIILPVVIHVFVFPLLVWAISNTFYYHTYAIQQTLSYTVSEYLYLLIVLYTVPFLVYRYLAGKAKPVETISESQIEDISNQFIHVVLISEGYKKYSIAVSDIYYCSANPPYINVHLGSQRYLHNETLKSFSKKLNPQEFVRVHKSALVNIHMVASYKTRLNGDYDLTLKNGVQLRVSRNFSVDFKDLFNKIHQLTIK